MGSLILAILLLILLVGLQFIKVPQEFKGVKLGATAVLVLLSIASFGKGAVAYNDAGYCQHIRTILGSETSKCDIGWYFQGWGSSTAWPHYITIGNVANPEDIKKDSISTWLDGPYRVKLADNWAGDITQSTRFGIPQNEEKFLKLARDLRTPENLIASTLVPSVKASLDTTANLFTMEEYYSGGQRDAFKNEYRDTITKGPAVTEKITDSSEVQKRVAPSSSEVVEDTSETASETNITIVEKKVDQHGRDIRPDAPSYTQYSITVSTAIIENLNPDDAYEAQVVKRKEALGRRVIARDQRLEQEEQRLLKIAEAESAIAQEQGEARKVQIKATTEAETAKKLALISAERAREEATIAKQTSEIELEKARIDSEAVQVKADAEAYAKKAILEADGALQAKLDAWVKAQGMWANAASTINVPSTVIGGNANSGSALGTVEAFMSMIMVKTAKELQVDPQIK